MARFKPPGNRPACHEPVPARRNSCPHCGASEADGWSDDAQADGLDLPDDSFDYDQFIQREFGGTPPPKVGFDRKTLWWATAVVLLAALTAAYWWH